MKRLTLTILTCFTLSAWGNNAPQFCVKEVEIYPELAPEEATIDDEEEDKLYPLTIHAEAFINKQHWEHQNNDDVYEEAEDWDRAYYPESKTEDIVFSGTLKTKEGDVLCQFTNAKEEEHKQIEYYEGILKLIFQCDKITKIDLEYELVGNLSYTTLTADPQFLSDYYPLAHGSSLKLEPYDISITYDEEEEEWAVTIESTDAKFLERIHFIHFYNKGGKRIHSELMYSMGEEQITVDTIYPYAHSFQIEFFEVEKHSYPIEQNLRIK